MATTAQLAGEIAHLNNANHIAILFAEQSGNALFASLGKRGFEDVRCGSGHDNAVGEFFDLLQLLRRNRLKVSEVETQEFLFIKRTGLNCVITNDIMKSSMQEVSRCVVFITR